MGNFKHGLRKHILYTIWNNAKIRCYNPKSADYKNYGGRGIIMCSEWKEDFLKFWLWAVTNGFETGLTLDRENFNGNYEPSNCRFITQKLQANNKSNNHNITYLDETKTLAEWAEVLGMKYHVLKFRINRGWSVERAFTQEVRLRSCN